MWNLTGLPAGAAAGVDRALPGRARLWGEFGLLFAAVPAAHVVFFEIFGPFIPFAAVFAASVLLLCVTPGFRWRSVVDCRGLLRHVPLIAVLFAVCVAVSFALTLALVPGC